jgi:hypothetical protein
MQPKPFAFVLMPFSSDFDDTYILGIKAACTDAGYYCERVDEQIFEETMLERIYNQIAKADLIVADMSTERECLLRGWLCACARETSDSPDEQL